MSRISENEWEQLSAYLDGQLSSIEKTKMDERLEARPDLRETLEEIRRLRVLLQIAPRRRAPYNFTLSREMVRPRIEARLVPAFSFASALAMVAFIVTLVIRLLPGTAMLASAPLQDMSTENALRVAAGPVSTQTAVGITWGTPPAGYREALPLGKGGEPAAGGMGPGPVTGETAAPAQSKAMPPSPMSTAPAQIDGGTATAAPKGIAPLSLPTPTVDEHSNAARPDATAQPTQSVQAAQAKPAAPAATAAPAGQEPQSKTGPSTTAATPAAVPSSATGPILGVPSDEQGQIIATSLPGPGQPLPLPQTQPVQRMWGIQVVLALAALLFGAVALFLRRRL